MTYGHHFKLSSETVLFLPIPGVEQSSVFLGDCFSLLGQRSRFGYLCPIK